MPLPESCGLNIAQEVLDFLDECAPAGETGNPPDRQTTLAALLEAYAGDGFSARVQTRFGVTVGDDELGPETTVGALLDLVFERLTQVP